MFVERVRDQLHVVMAFSPIGDAFRDRLRRFPAIVNCCTIDWFQVRTEGMLARRRDDGEREDRGRERRGSPRREGRELV